MSTSLPNKSSDNLTTDRLSPSTEDNMASAQSPSSDLPQRASSLFAQQGEHSSITASTSQEDTHDRDPEKHSQEPWSPDHHHNDSMGLQLGDAILCLGCGKIHSCSGAHSSTSTSAVADPATDKYGKPVKDTLEKDTAKAPDPHKAVASSEQPASSSTQDESKSLAGKGEHTSEPGASYSTAGTAMHADNLDRDPEKSPQEPWSPEHHDIDDLGVNFDKTFIFDKDGGMRGGPGPVASTDGLPPYPPHPDTARIMARASKGSSPRFARSSPPIKSGGEESPRSQSAELATSLHAAEHDIPTTPSPLPTPGQHRSYSAGDAKEATAMSLPYVVASPPQSPAPVSPGLAGKNESTHNEDPAFSVHAEEHKHLGDEPARSSVAVESSGTGGHEGEGQVKHSAGPKKEGIIEKVKHVLAKGEGKEGK